MNVRLMYNFDFLAGIYYQDQLQINRYTAHVTLLTQTEDTSSSNVAMDRVKNFVHGELFSTVFFGPQDHDKAEMFHVMGVNVTTLPEEPVDQIIGMMLYFKLNAIMEDRMTITSLDISSTLGDSVWYSLDGDDNMAPFENASESAWWYSSSTQHHDLDNESVPDNVVRVMPSDWHEYGLQWPEECAEPTNNTVIYPNFQRNETK